MKFLFFDTECACCYKHGNGVICEFGYILTDEKFNILEKEALLVAPEAQFQWYVIKNLLAFKKEEYEASPNFKEQYEKIKSLLTDADTTVIGHTTDIDAHYLNFAAKRYGVPFINFEFYDVKKIHMHKRKIKRGISVENILKDLNLEFDGHLHRSDDDAYATLLAFKELCNIAQLDGPSLISEYAEFKGRTKDGNIKKAKMPPIVFTEEEKEASRREMLERYAVKNIVNKKNFFVLAQLKDGDLQSEVIESRLKGKKVLIDRDYQKMHFKEMLSLITLIKQYGGECRFNPEECDIFVDAAFEEAECEFSYYKKIASRRNAQIITLEQLLSVFNVTEQELLDMPFPSYKAFKNIRKSKRAVATIKKRNSNSRRTIA